MSTEMRTGFVVGCLGAVLLIAVICWIAKRGKKSAKMSEYDERQCMVRGRAFQYSYLTLLLYSICYAIAEEVLERYIFDSGATGIFTGVILSLAVFGGYCIWNGAYMTNNQNAQTVSWLLGWLGVVNMVLGILNLLHGEMLADGRLSFRVINLLLGILFVMFFVIFRIRNRIDGREAE